MSKLNPNAQKWVKALRSGKYKQAKKALGRGERRCCLGVLCDLAVKAKVISKPATVEFKRKKVLEYDGSIEILPQSVADWVGLRSKIGLFENGDDCLSRRNDRGVGFKKIADLIEQNADELFLEQA